MASLLIGVSTWIEKPFPGFLILENGVVASAGLTHWPAISEGSIFQSRVITYDGTRFSGTTDLDAYIASRPIGTSVRYEFQSRTETFDRRIDSRRFTSSDAFLLFGVTLFSAIALLGVALALTYMAPSDPASIGCALALAITGTFALTALDLYGPYRFFRVHAFTECFLGAGGIHMALVFPHRRRIAVSHPWLIRSAYGVSTAIATLNQLLLFRPVGYTLTHLLAMAWAGTAFTALAVSQVDAFLRPASYASRQRVSVLAFGTFASITPAVLVAVASSFTGGEAPENLISWTGAFFPLAVGYAVLKSDLLEVDSVLRSTVNYILITIVVASTYTAFITAAQWLLSDSSQQSRTLSTIAFSVFISLIILPIRDRIQSWVDRIFFRANYDFRATVEDASNQLARLIELDRIRERITETVNATLNPEFIELTVLPHELASASSPSNSNVENDELTDLESGAIDVRFRSRDRTVAVLRLGRKLSGRYYSGLDRGLLKVLANQGAIAIENALAVVELQEMNRTLERRVFERTEELASALENLTSTQAQLLQAERLAAVGELAAGIAHEVNNPLNFARNSLRTLQSLVTELADQSTRRSSKDTENCSPPSASSGIAANQEPLDPRELAGDILQLSEILGAGLDRTARLVQDLRDFATPKQSIRSPYRFSTLVDDAMSLIGSTIRERDIEVRVRTDDEEPELIGDQQSIEQVILNILKNAVDSLDGREHGIIEISIHADRPTGSLVVEFEDNGPGVLPENADRLFEPFFSTKPPGKGTGLGLALCKRVIQEHRGEITLLPTSRSGARFQIRLPLDENASTTSTKETHETESPE